MTLNTTIYRLINTIILLSLSATLTAGPWIETGDARLRHHIQLLADRHIITVPITTWPLMWSGVANDIQQANTSQLDQQTLWSLRYVRFAFQQQTGKNLRVNGEITVGNDINALRTFSDNRREKAEAKAAIDWLGDKLAVHLVANYSDDPDDGDDYRVDGSYLSYQLGNWALAAGAIDRWWGPAWHNGLILSNNARPIPGLSLQRNHSKAFKSRWLSWIGPWQATAFAGQLESERAIPDAYLLGGRINFKPSPNLEIGLARTAQWGGEGRPQNGSTLKDLILGNDNRGDDDIDQSNEPGNQLASVDLRYSFASNHSSNAIYGQFTGEDESQGMPSRGIVQLGLESSFLYRDIQHRIILEASDTTASSYSDDRPNYAYEHAIYKDGYRYKGRPIGASMDNDSRQITLAADHYLANGHQLSWSIASLKINSDNTNVAATGGSRFGDGVDLKTASLSYHLPVSDHWLISAGLHYASESYFYNNQELESGGNVTLKFKY